MDLPLLPIDDPALELEVDSFRLGNVDRLDVLPVSTVCFNGGWVIIIWWRFVQRAPNRRNVNVDHLLGVTVENWCKIQGVRVLTVVNTWPVVHQGLL